MYATNHHTEVAFGFGIMKSFLGNIQQQYQQIKHISMQWQYLTYQPPWRKTVHFFPENIL